jgi:hypothetical protein
MIFLKLKNFIKKHAFVSSIAIVGVFTAFAFYSYNLLKTNENSNKISSQSDKEKTTKQSPYINNSEYDEGDNNYLKKQPARAISAINNCGINPTKDCALMVFGDENIEFSDTFLKIMEGAGTSFGTPSAIILAYMSGIGTLGEYGYLFMEEAEEDLKKAYLWGPHIPGCDNLDYLEKGPYDWILKWFVATLHVATPAGYSAYDVLEEISEGRGNAADRCNFLDATYVVSAHFSQADVKGCETSYKYMIDELESISWGDNPEEAYEDDSRYDEGGKVHEVFKACSKSN